MGYESNLPWQHRKKEEGEVLTKHCTEKQLTSPTPHSPIHHTPPPLLSYFPPQEFSPKHTAAVEGHSSVDKPVHQGRQWCQSRVSVSSLSLPSSLQMRSCCSNYFRLDCEGKKGTRHKRPDIANQWQFRPRISTAVISKLQWQSKLLVIIKHTFRILILQCYCCVAQCFLIWTLKQASLY